MWITTDPSGVKTLWKSKPNRIKNGWIGDGDFMIISEGFPFDDFPSFVQLQEWKDAPIQVKFEIKKR
jgi:hypothetical protein